MSFLLDTNVLSELRKRGRADAGVMRWHAEVLDDRLYTSVLVIGEARRGIHNLRRRDPRSADALDQWLKGLIDSFADRILPIDAAIADRWGPLNVPDPLTAIDGLLAATGLVRDLTVVTRNTRDIGRTGCRVLNPFTG